MAKRTDAGDAEPELVPRLFVYGTLLRGESRHHYVKRAKPVRILSGFASGYLLNLGHYPAFVPASGRSARRVRGEIVEFSDIESALAVLDRVEGIASIPEDRREYRREIKLVTADEGVDLPAWVYVANRVPAGARRIPADDWRRWRRDRKAPLR